MPDAPRPGNQSDERPSPAASTPANAVDQAKLNDIVGTDDYEAGAEELQNDGARPEAPPRPPGR